MDLIYLIWYFDSYKQLIYPFFVWCLKSKEKEEQKINPNTLRGRGRSRSNTRDRPKRPPLISAVSDPALITPQTNVLLTQLLTTSKYG